MLIPIVIPQSKNGRKNMSLVFGIIFALLAGGIMFINVDGYNKDIQLHDSYNVSTEEMINSDDIFRFSGAAIIDYYATTAYEDSPSGLNLQYCFDDEEMFEDYCNDEKENFLIGIGMGAFFGVAGIVLIVLGAVKRGPKEPSKKELAAAREMLKKNNEYNTPPEDDRFDYINSDDYFGKPDEDR